MVLFKAFKFLFFLLILVSCSKNEIKDSSIKEKSLELQVLEVYNIGKDALDGGDVLYAAKKFNGSAYNFYKRIFTSWLTD